ncbi:hypothetical protein BDN72DRAFT_129695 [Pluteus cervinus]|uniref:Uncharacterized protein n=1 Tax=Pluteus cervinus TaxID=181527 RepID=A0ACD3AMJ6_9AGAR|nr:hypothetical protein BDN72DRAFT_129695 [Pluteus cervinus]
MDFPDHPTDTSFSIAGLSAGESITKIDNEISRLKSQIQYLRNLRNTIPPISKLPSEIISRIFLRCGDIDIGPDEDLRFKLGLTTLRISWVSRWWRAVALSDPVLWSFITIPHSYDRFRSDDCLEADVDYLNTCTERSGDVDLTVSLHTPPRNFLESSFQHLRRIREIDIDVIRGLLLGYKACWTQPAPKLVSFSISRQIFGDGKCPDASNIFGRTFPNLRHVFLHECEFRHDFPLISAPGLRTLHIVNPKRKIPLRNFAQRLCLMPALRDLRLDDCFVDTVASDHTPTKCPKLERLVIKDSVEPMFSLLGSLDLSSASVDLKLEQGLLFEAELAENLRIVRDHCKAIQFWGDKGVEDLSINFIAGDWASLMCTASSYPLPAQRHQLQLTQHFSRGSIFPSPYHSPLRAYGFFPLENLRNVSLTGVSRKAVYELSTLSSPEVLKIQNAADDVDNSSSWLATPGLFSCVKQLEVDGITYPNFQAFQDSL